MLNELMLLVAIAVADRLRQNRRCPGKMVKAVALTSKVGMLW